MIAVDNYEVQSGDGSAGEGLLRREAGWVDAGVEHANKCIRGPNVWWRGRVKAVGRDHV